MKHTWGGRCSPHINGVPPEMKPFFVADCRVCQEKLAAGKVTGLEPLPFTDFRRRQSHAISAHIFRARHEKEERRRG